MNARKKIGIIDLTTNSSTRSLYKHILHTNFASVMPQAIGVWCEEAGHDVTLVCYTGFGNVVEDLPDNLDLAFIGTFTQGAQLAYALSNRLRSEGTITVLGGPHARCYPEDAQQYFDYVLGFTDKSAIREVLSDCSQYRPIGTYISAKQQPTALPSVRERWQFIEPILQKAPLVKAVPMLGSMGCPYTCAFCIDATIPYRPFDFEVIKADLRFLLRQFKRPLVGWHDPNFGIRFDDYMGALRRQYRRTALLSLLKAVYRSCRNPISNGSSGTDLRQSYPVSSRGMTSAINRRQVRGLGSKKSRKSLTKSIPSWSISLMYKPTLYSDWTPTKVLTHLN